MPLNKPFNRYLPIEAPDSAAVVDFLGPFPVTIRATLDGGQLHVSIISATEAAPYLLDEVLAVPPRDDEDE